jgi:hypothetical protein
MIAARTFDALANILTDLGIPEELILPNAFIYRDLQLDSTETIEKIA